MALAGTCWAYQSAVSVASRADERTQRNHLRATEDSGGAGALGMAAK